MTVWKTEPKFGDLLRYPLSEDKDERANWVFMHIAMDQYKDIDYLFVMVIRTHWQDDQWLPGDTVAAGVNELVPLDE